MTNISLAHNHKVDWMFAIDHGGFTQGDLHLEYSKMFITQLAKHLYISPMHSQAGVITYGGTANVQIPLNVQEGNQCEFNKRVNKLTLTPGKSDMNQALVQAINQLKTNGRHNAHKVTVLITSAGWENVGTNPYLNVNKTKNIGTLIVVVLVFDRAQSIVSPVILSFASERPPAAKLYGREIVSQDKYAFEIEAKRGILRRLYRHFQLAVEKMSYLPLQVPSRHCPACATKQACVCDVNLYNTYHCEEDTYEPLMTVGCPADMTVQTEVGKPSAQVTWLSAKAVDYSSSMVSRINVESDNVPKVKSTPKAVNATHVVNTFNIGKSLVTHRFYDAAQNSINCSFTVIVLDGESPVILNCPQHTIVDNATALMSTKLVVWAEVKATDNSLEPPTLKLYIDNVPKPNDSRYFPIGTSNVRLVFSDQSKNFAVCQFSVSVQDFQPPVVQQCVGPNATVYSSGTQTYVDWVKPQFIDNSGLTVKVSTVRGPGYYRIGEHTITYVAEDVHGNSRACNFTFTVKGYPCPQLLAPFNGAIICDNAAPGATCQILCNNPFDFESIPELPKLPEKYSCIGKGVWWPTDKVPHCVVMQGTNKKLPKTYYFDGDCSDYNVSQTIKQNAANHYEGFVEGGYFKEAWGRKVSIKDFENPTCGAGVAITTPPTTLFPPTTTTSTTTSPATTATTATTVPLIVPTNSYTTGRPSPTIKTLPVTVVRSTSSSFVVTEGDGTIVIGKK